MISPVVATFWPMTVRTAFTRGVTWCLNAAQSGSGTTDVLPSPSGARRVGSGLCRLGEWSHLRLALRVRERAQFSGRAARDGRRLAAGLEAGEVGAIAPRKRAAQTNLGLDRSVVDDVDGPLVIGRSLSVAREVAEVPARREHSRHARD